MSSSASVPSSGTSVSKAKDPLKKMWMETNWANLSRQGQSLGMPKLPYFDPATMLLSKEVNEKLWRQMGQLYNLLGPDQAPYACPVLLESRELEWRSYLNGSKGDKADVYDEEDW